MASQAGRQKTKHPGVFYRLAKRPGGKGVEKIFYVVFRQGDKVVEEKVPKGREKTDKCNAIIAVNYRHGRMNGTILSPKEARLAKEAEKEKLSQKWTIQKLWDEYESQKKDTKTLRTDKGRYNLYLKEPFGDKEPQEILQLDVDRVRVRLLKKKSAQTCKHVLSLLKRIAKFGTDKGLCKGLSFTISKNGAVKFPTIDNQVTEFLTPEEVERLLEAIKNDKHPQAGNIMLMALYTGMRRSEILSLRWRDVDLQNGFINIAISKGGKAQKIPMNTGARQVLEGIGKGKGGYVFPGNLGNKRSNINRAINAIKTAAKLPDDFRPLHGLRHHYASMLASSGKVDLYTLQKLLTHKDHRMTERYAHLHDDTLKRAANIASDIISEAMNGKKEGAGK